MNNMIIKKTGLTLRALLGLAILSWIACTMADTAGVEYQEGYGVVADKDHTASWVQTQVVIVNKVPITSTIHHPDSWKILVEFDQQRDWVRVSEEFYESTKIGTSIPIVYGVGRFSGDYFYYQANITN